MVRTAWYVIVWGEVLQTGKKVSEDVGFKIQGVGQCLLGNGQTEVWRETRQTQLGLVHISHGKCDGFTLKLFHDKLQILPVLHL